MIFESLKRVENDQGPGSKMDFDVFKRDEAGRSVSELENEGQQPEVRVDDDSQGEPEGRLLRKRPLVLFLFQEVLGRPPLGRAVLQVLAVVQPRVTESLVGGGTLQRVRAEQAADEVSGVRADVAPRVFVKLEVTGQDFLEEGFVGVGFVRVGVKWRISGEQNVRDDPDAPNVGCRGARLPGDHLWRQVAGSPAHRGPFLELPLVFREPEIGDKDLGVFVVVVVEQVLELEVPVDDALLVHEGNCAEKLNEQICRLDLREGDLLEEPIENFTTLEPKK